jgi:glycosyltransferase involved in cell wall biosynthesis
MRVLHITNAGGGGRVQLGGAERAVAELTAYFATKLGWEVGVIAPEEFLHHGTLINRVQAFPEPFDRGALRRLTRITRGFRPHVGITHLLRGTLLGQPALAACRVPVRVSNLHNSLVQIEAASSRARRVASYRHAFWAVTRLCSHATVAISASNEADLVTRQRIPASKTHLIDNWVDDSFFDPRLAGRGRQLRGELGLAEAPLVLGLVGRLEAQKNVAFAVRLLSALPEAHLVIVGAGVELPMIRGLAAGLGVTDRVHLAGYQSDVRPWYASVDVLLVPSLFEGFGRVAVEALAVGTPVIGNDVPGLAGLLTEVGPPAAWPRPLEPMSEWVRLARTASLTPAARESVRTRIAQRFSMVAAGEGYRTMYTELLGQD